MINVTLKDGTVIECEKGISVLDAAKQISEGLARNACCGIVNGNTEDLRYALTDNCTLEICTFDSDEGKRAYRHTCSHILAQAVKRLYPQAKLAIGPSTADGFYYDFDDVSFTPEDFEKIEKEMKAITKEALDIERFELPREEAIRLTEQMNEPYKTELIRDLPEDAVISFYKQGEFTDLCAGPHLMNTKTVKAFKITSVAGAYWRGNEKNKMLVRLYATAYTKAADLEAYLNMIEEAKKRDHRRLGRELGLFCLLDEGPGFPFFLPKGMTLKNVLLDYWRQIHKKAGYVEIQTPMMLNRQL